MDSRRRFSKRLEKIPKQKRPFYGDTVTRSHSSSHNNGGSHEKSNNKSLAPIEVHWISDDEEDPITTPKLDPRKKLRLAQGNDSNTEPNLPSLVMQDISCGLEDIPIPATNQYDHPPVAPQEFKYIRTVEVAASIKIPPNAPGCNCKGRWCDQRYCSCAKLNGGAFPYVRTNAARLTEARDVIYECGPSCGCGPTCLNRASQHGFMYKLEVYKTKSKGWAVKSVDFIPSGAPVCEYAGILRRNNELDSVSDNDYIFEIDCWHTMKEMGGRERRLGDVSTEPEDKSEEGTERKNSEDEPEPEFCIDAGTHGNVARFINHSCDPNLFVQCILSSHQDVKMARVVLFAADDIQPDQELTYDYGYALDSVIGRDGEIKTQPCFCGTSICRKRLY